MRQSFSKSGMSLVELLVVIAIIGVLAVTVLPNLSSTSGSRRSREAVRSITSFIARAQSRAIGQSHWRGVMALAPSTTSFGATELVFADVPAFYRGDIATATLTIPPVALTAMTTTLTATASVESLATLLLQGGTSGDLIRFHSRDPWYEIDSGAVPVPALTGTSVRFRLRAQRSDPNDGEDLGQRLNNTPWPTLDVPMPFEIQRQPQPSGLPFSLADGRVIDFRWSGVGPERVGQDATTYRRFVRTSSVLANESPPRRLAVLFDGTGRMRQLLLTIVAANGTDLETVRLPVTGPVFLLVGRGDRAGSVYAALSSSDDTLGANWQYADSTWVAIDPATGIVRAAECLPDPGINAPTMGEQERLARLIDSQRIIRAALATSGR